MLAGEGEGGLRGVIERRSGPVHHRGVTKLAILGKTRRDMIGIGGALEILEVAGGASHAQRRVLTVGMALRAGYSGMFAKERELRGAVIESGSCPILRAVAKLAVHRKTGCHVIRGSGGLKVLHVARYAIGADVGVVTVDMALHACS